MANPARRRRNRAAKLTTTVRRRRRSNPMVRRRRHHNRHRSSNPFGMSTMQLLTDILAGGVSAIITPAVTEGALGMFGMNAGVMGYLGTLGVAGLLGWLTSAFTKRKDLGIAVAVGGSASLIMRIWQENVSGTHASPAGNNPDFAGSGAGMSGYFNTPFALPSITGGDGSLNKAVVQNPWGAVTPTANAALASGGSGQMLPVAPASGKLAIGGKFQ